MIRSTVVLIVLLALLVQPVMAQDEMPQPVGLRPDAPEFAVHGPYWVGTRQFVVENLERPLPVRVWYPALNLEGNEESITYTAELRWVPMPDVSATVAGQALGEADPDLSDAPYPLVVFSHGAGMYAVAYANVLEHLASHGFVVIAPEHSEVFSFEDFSFGDEAVSHVERPRDIGRTLDYAESLTADGGALEGLIDMEQVAVAGHSYGGYTALAAAGARIDMTSFHRRCETARAAGDPGAWVCDPLETIEDRMVIVAGMDSAPEGLWPFWGDPRVDAIIPMATGDSFLFDQAGLAEVTVPVMAIGGTADTMVPFDWSTPPVYEYVFSPQKTMVVFEGGEHGLFVEWDAQPWWVDVFGYGFIAEPVWDIDRANDLVHHFTTAFLKDVFYGDEEAHAALMPENVNFPGITYQTTMR